MVDQKTYKRLLSSFVKNNKIYAPEQIWKDYYEKYREERLALLAMGRGSIRKYAEQYRWYWGYENNPEKETKEQLVRYILKVVGFGLTGQEKVEFSDD